MTSKEIRENFLSFFSGKGHTIVRSAPMVIKNDPTLMFTNAGMNQFKDWFLGNSPIKYPRVTDTQKCLRVSGKHNDLEEVGHDSYHHTMFEMLGNWSFGDYFKKEAIEWAWELLTEVYKIDKERLYVTVFEGDLSDKIEKDEEASTYWERFLPKERILLGNKKDNFWEMGDTGPCGPCSEIHVDLRGEEQRKAVPGAELVNTGDPLVIEIWNLVFIQFNRKADGSLEPLPQKHVDTGMGLERLCIAVNGLKSNYDSDLFQGIIEKISDLSGKRYDSSEDISVAMRVVADHIRAICFSIADGQLPSNAKAGYVIRRILRRAVRYGYTFLGFDTPFLYKLIPSLIEIMGDAFPELEEQRDLIEKIIQEEEEAFLRTLEKGIKLMDTVMERSKESKVISGIDAFTMYDTFGFPIDLSGLIAKENGYTIDIEGFEAELAKQRERGRSDAAVEEGDWTEVHGSLSPQFVGYDHTEQEVKIIKYRSVKAKNKELFQFVFDKSPFYAESGGQVGDSGIIESPAGEKIIITTTVKENNLNIHLTQKLPSDLNSVFNATVDIDKRSETANNHTATHLLHYSLRKVLGNHIEQKGSYVSPSYFRFDFSHYEKVTSEQLREVERMVNNLIRQNNPREEFRDIPIDQAREMGAIALFGEKYGDSVRVVKFFDSIELCGGTHTSSSGTIGLFKIISESAVASGVRRIEATTGRHAEAIIERIEDTIHQTKELFNNTPNIVSSIQKLISDNESLKKSIDEYVRAKVQTVKEALIKDSKMINGIRILMIRNGVYTADLIKDLAFQIHKEMENSAFIAAYQTPDEKPQLALSYTADLVNNGANASVDIKEAAKVIRGGGGGQNFLATAGGKEIDSLNIAVDVLLKSVTKQ